MKYKLIDVINMYIFNEYDCKHRKAIGQLSADDCRLYPRKILAKRLY